MACVHAGRFPRLHAWLGLALGAVLTLATPAWPATIVCPAQIEVEQHATHLPATMKALDRERNHRWTSVEFSDGPPEEQAWLAPDETHTSGATFTNVWRFPPGAAGTWLGCGYTGTSVLAVMRLPDSIRVCTVRYDASVTPPSATTLDCH